MHKSTEFSKSTPQFDSLIYSIRKILPLATLIFILITYLITAIINSIFLPLPKFLSVSSALVLAFGRFLVVFTQLIISKGNTNKSWQKMVAGLLTLAALTELYFSVISLYPNDFLPIFLNISAIIILGLALELSFLEKVELAQENKNQVNNQELNFQEKTKVS
jgi:hypothetical protein